MSQLATLTAVKAKLELAADAIDQDDAIQAVLDAAEAYVLERTGYELVATEHVETVQYPKTQHYRRLLTARRPVATLTAVEGRALGQADWTTLEADLLDAALGTVVVITGCGRPAPWFRWRQPSWDLLRLTYTTSPLEPIPADLADACAALASYWYERQLAGAKSRELVGDMPVGKIEQFYLSAPVPAWVESQLARHLRVQSRWA